MNVSDLRRALADAAAKEARSNRERIRAFIEGRPIEAEEVVAAMKALSMPVEVVEQAARLWRELQGLRMPSSNEVADLQDNFARMSAALKAEIVRLDALGVKALTSTGGWDTKVHPMARASYDRERAARFALDAAVTVVARADELREQVRILLGEQDPKKEPAPRMVVSGDADPNSRPVRSPDDKTRLQVDFIDGKPVLRRVASNSEVRERRIEGKTDEVVKRFLRQPDGSLKQVGL